MSPLLPSWHVPGRLHSLHGEFKVGVSHIYGVANLGQRSLGGRRGHSCLAQDGLDPVSWMSSASHRPRLPDRYWNIFSSIPASAFCLHFSAPLTLLTLAEETWQEGLRPTWLEGVRTYFLPRAHGAIGLQCGLLGTTAERWRWQSCHWHGRRSQWCAK